METGPYLPFSSATSQDFVNTDETDETYMAYDAVSYTHLTLPTKA